MPSAILPEIEKIDGLGPFYGGTNAVVTNADMQTTNSNSVVHAIDTVLIPGMDPAIALTPPVFVTGTFRGNLLLQSASCPANPTGVSAGTHRKLMHTDSNDMEGCTKNAVRESAETKGFIAKYHGNGDL